MAALKVPSKSLGPRAATAIDEHIGGLIRDRRCELGLSQEHLATALTVTQAQIVKYENGNNRISATRLLQCARVLQVPVAWFYRDIERSEAPAIGTPPVADQERELLNLFRSMPDRSRVQLLGIARVLAD